MENNGKFSLGFLLGAIGLVASSLLIALFLMLLRRDVGEFSEILGSMLLAGLFIWIPLSIAIGSVSKRKGSRSALWFAAASFAISLLVTGGCWGIITGMGG
ncbi:hypothetical protein [Youngiibacter multivorans]|uniref:Uncharacterized protein n=1 Tax=Youngiibacter multivorans TaxID=937251 RepID=A0ABS4G6V0_9CLOT|nr:hypothetical protein [Youngiibacter multivorans]MBP1920258.1 hypothetical protein [Youngiibacter multivorans]